MNMLMSLPYCSSSRTVVEPVSYTHLDVYKRQPRFNSDGIAVVETTHINLSSRSAGCRTVGMSVDVERTHTADTFAAVVVEYNRFFSFADQLFVQNIQHFEEMCIRDSYYGAAGVTYGYARQLARHLSLEFSFGIGYLTTEYKKYTPYEGDIVWTTSGRYNFIGPTKAKVSLVWLIKRGR